MIFQLEKKQIQIITPVSIRTECSVFTLSCENQGSVIKNEVRRKVILAHISGYLN